MAIASGLLKAFANRGSTRDKIAESTFLHAAARACGWSIGQVEESRAILSYGWVRAEWREAATFILLHNEGAAAAFTVTDQPWTSGNLRFVDRPEFVTATQSLQWPIHFLTASELNHSLSSEDREFLTSLDSMMAYDVKYWNPETVGQVIFNWWD